MEDARDRPEEVEKRLANPRASEQRSSSVLHRTPLLVPPCTRPTGISASVGSRLRRGPREVHGPSRFLTRTPVDPASTVQSDLAPSIHDPATSAADTEHVRTAPRLLSSRLAEVEPDDERGMETEAGIEALRAVIVAAFPELADSDFRLRTAGWHSTAVEVDDRLIFKFPRHPEAERALVREAGLLAVVRPAVTLPVPDLALHPGPPLFSRHAKLPGDHLLAADYARLPERARQRLAQQVAGFYAELHRLDPAEMRAAGAQPIEPWLPADTILERALPALPPALRELAKRTISAWRELPPDPAGTTYGFFDGHGWNMAFDHDRGHLGGIYDFADSGLGDLHQEFIYTSFVDPDLTARVVAAYEARTGRALDRGRIALLTGVHRLSELAQLADDPDHRPEMIRHVAAWAKTQQRPHRRGRSTS